jgi:hypothetical protein
MTRKLNEADRAAVDMLFDRINAASNGGRSNGGNGGDGVVTMANAVAEERLSAVTRILATLEAMPAPEPSPDLAVRTLQRVARASGMPASMAAPATAAPAFIDPTQPLA